MVGRGNGTEVEAGQMENLNKTFEEDDGKREKRELEVTKDWVAVVYDRTCCGFLFTVGG